MLINRRVGSGPQSRLGRIEGRKGSISSCKLGRSESLPMRRKGRSCHGSDYRSRSKGRSRWEWGWVRAILMIL